LHVKKRQSPLLASNRSYHDPLMAFIDNVDQVQYSSAEEYEDEGSYFDHEGLEPISSDIEEFDSDEESDDLLLFEGDNVYVLRDNTQLLLTHGHLTAQQAVPVAELLDNPDEFQVVLDLSTPPVERSKIPINTSEEVIIGGRNSDVLIKNCGGQYHPPVGRVYNGKKYTKVIYMRCLHCFRRLYFEVYGKVLGWVHPDPNQAKRDRRGRFLTENPNAPHRKALRKKCESYRFMESMKPDRKGRKRKELPLSFYQ
jgi:hypothetical protein